MQWSKMNGQQRALLNSRAVFRKVVRNGKVVRQVPVNSWAEAVVTAKAMDRDQRERDRVAGHAEMLRALDGFTAAEIAGLATKCKPGRAYGANELQRTRATAMPMQYFRKGGGPA